MPTLFLPLGYIVYVVMENELFLKTIILTIVTSIGAYYISAQLIGVFKDMLCDKGLFGRDLNKSGEQRYKLKV